MLAPSSEHETISPGAHSVDCSSRKRTTGKLDSTKPKIAVAAAHTKDVSEKTLDGKAQNNNESVLI
jgi:hypothetical protein